MNDAALCVHGAYQRTIEKFSTISKSNLKLEMTVLALIEKRWRAKEGARKSDLRMKMIDYKKSSCFANYM